MKRLTLIVIFAVTLIGTNLTLSSMPIDGSLAEAHERKRFRADLQTTSRLVEPPLGRSSDQHGLSPVVGLLEVVGAGDATFLGDIDNDCSVNHYEPSRGITNLSTGDATIFLDQMIGID